MRGDRIIQMYMAVVLSVCGMALLFMGLLMAPRGVIDASVLVAFGEVMTFVGGLLGIDYLHARRGS